MGETYTNAGVSLEKEGTTISILSRHIVNTFPNRKGRIGEVAPYIGHFAHCIKFRDNYLVLCTDGVGTKVLVAQLMERYDTIGIDMIAMNVNDLICVGAEPLALVDYLAVEHHHSQMIEQIAKGIADGANRAGIAVIGGETATLKGVITGVEDKGFDLAGTCLGVVHKERVITGERAAPGQAVVGLASSGIHANGLTLARKVLLESMSVDDILYDEVKVGDALLEPTMIYVKPVLEMLEAQHSHIFAMYNITGSGFLKFRRLKTLGFSISDLLPIPKIFQKIQDLGRVTNEEMFKTFNMGTGFAIVTDKPGPLISIAKKYGIAAKVIGETDSSDVITIQEKGVLFPHAQ